MSKQGRYAVRPREGMPMRPACFARLAFAVLVSACPMAAGPARAQDASKPDTLKVAIGQINNWENQAPTLGQEAGIFKKHGLVIEATGTQGTGETIQPVSARAPRPRA